MAVGTDPDGNNRVMATDLVFREPVRFLHSARLVDEFWLGKRGCFRSRRPRTGRSLAVSQMTARRQGAPESLGARQRS
jgi:hypothetical protein